MTRAGLFRALLWCFPQPFREEYGGEMRRAFTEELAEARGRGWGVEAALWLRTIGGVLSTAPEEHIHVRQQDLRYALRTLRAQPGFTAITVLSLALGIGANVAIYSLIDSVLTRLLPVRAPEELVMLTDPGSRGAGVGSSQGERALLTYEEFVQLRDRTSVFSQLMAAQSAIERLPVRVEGGEPEDAEGRMVSAEYFGTLGVPAMMGRTLGSEDGDKPAVAVISHAYWQRRLGGRAGVIGMSLAVRRTAYTVIGVMPPSFFGETVGERPDIWLPLAMQPEILPGRDWLHDDAVGLQKAMWLHVFGRLKPGVTAAQAQAAANVTFQQGLTAYYASAPTAEMRKRFLDQHLRLRPAWTGASGLRQEFGQPLSLMLAAAGLVLTIACANLGNLMLARATARTREVAVRLALGARRSDLVRQWLTESMLIAAAGGAAGLGAAWVLRRGLLLLVSDSIQLPEMPDGRVLLFALGLTVATGALLGLLPALRTLGIGVNAGLREQGRGLTASAGWLRAGKLIVAGQIALSLPLLMGAGLLVRTLGNLERVEVGFDKDNLLIIGADVMTAGYAEPRRQALFERLAERVRATPGVSMATYSRHGLFVGGDASDEMEVEGFTPRGEEETGSRYDHVGPGYFSTLRVPMRLGRELTERDHAGAPRVCVVNEEFARRFFAGRNPIGLHVTQVYGTQRNRYEVVGVAANLRKNNLRGPVDPRYFVPMAQPVDVPTWITFAVRASGDAGAVGAAVRRAILAEDPNLPVTKARLVTELVGGRMVQDRLLARLSLAFGVVALGLSAMGLYGVMSYGVTRRTSEIGIRKALGAGEGTVVAMILQESTLLFAAGVVMGGALAVASLRWIESRLFGLAPTDPAVFGAAAGVLGVVVLAAAWIPARRAARVDPLEAIRYE